MTYKDLLKRDHPENVNIDFKGKCRGCPASYGYAPPGDGICNGDPYEVLDRNCKKCWEREVPDGYSK